jgi:hypothetical protein
MAEVQSSKTVERGGPPSVTVTVFAPRNADSREFTFPQTMKVAEAARQAADAVGYAAGGNPTFENADNEVLDRNKPLVAAGVRDGDKLELVDAGGGV